MRGRDLGSLSDPIYNVISFYAKSYDIGFDYGAAGGFAGEGNHPLLALASS